MTLLTLLCHFLRGNYTIRPFLVEKKLHINSHYNNILYTMTKKYNYYHINSLSLCDFFVRLLYPSLPDLDYRIGFGFILFSYTLIIQFSHIISSNQMQYDNQIRILY